VTEAYQSLRTALIFGRKDDGCQVVLITGTAPQEGKTTTLVNIARLLAGSGEATVVLDCDLRRAQLHHRLGLPREPGFTDLFTKHEDLELIQDTRIPNLFAITAGPPPPNPPAVLARKQVGDLLDRLRQRYEWILIDSPPLASVTDALLLARHADMVLMVVQHNKVDKRLVKRNVAAIRKATPNLLGVVLNAVDAQAKSYGYYYYQHHDEPTPGAGKVAAPGPVGASRS
jgi:capsular exopolysaccharide synthesis family protein